MSNTQPWDQLSSYFKAPLDGEKPPADVADNIYIAWPVFLQFLKQHLPIGKRILDFGCGSGAFTARLSSLGYHAMGVDPSPEMIKTGRRVLGPSVDLRVGDSQSLIGLGWFDAVVSVMALPFVEDIQSAFDHIRKSINPGGIFIFAVFNPTYVSDWIQHGSIFTEFDSVTDPKVGTVEFENGEKVTTYIRTVQELDDLLVPYGFVRFLEAYPPFTPEFLAEYPISGPTQHSEYLILGYRLSK